LDKLSDPRPPSELRRFPLRWLGCYLVLWFVPSPLGELPWIGQPLYSAIYDAKTLSARWFSSLWRGAQGVDAVMSGGTDRTLDYYVVALLLMVSFVMATALSLTRDRDRELFDSPPSTATTRASSTSSRRKSSTPLA